MFFRHHQPVPVTFDQRLETLREAGFSATPLAGGRARVTRGHCGAVVSDGRIEQAGWLIGEEIALLEDGGYQKFWAVGGGRRAPAVASQLRELHAFEEDLREGLGLESEYNTSLGTTNDVHVYDRLQGR